MLIWRNLKPAALVQVFEAVARTKAAQDRAEDAAGQAESDRRANPPLTVLRSER